MLFSSILLFKYFHYHSFHFLTLLTFYFIIFITFDTFQLFFGEYTSFLICIVELTAIPRFRLMITVLLGIKGDAFGECFGF